MFVKLKEAKVKDRIAKALIGKGVSGLTRKQLYDISMADSVMFEKCFVDMKGVYIRSTVEFGWDSSKETLYVASDKLKNILHSKGSFYRKERKYLFQRNKKRVVKAIATAAAIVAIIQYGDSYMSNSNNKFVTTGIFENEEKVAKDGSTTIVVVDSVSPILGDSTLKGSDQKNKTLIGNNTDSVMESSVKKHNVDSVNKKY